MTAYTEVNVNPGIIMAKTGMQRSSENKAFKSPLLEKTIRVKGMLTAIAVRMPALTVAAALWCFLSCLCFIISRETVIGIPEDVIVIKRPKTDKDI